MDGTPSCTTLLAPIQGRNYNRDGCSLLPPYLPRHMLTRSLDLGAKSRTSRPEQRFPVGFSTWVSRYLTYGGLGAAGSAAEA